MKKHIDPEPDRRYIIEDHEDEWVEDYQNDMEASSTMEAFKEDCETNEYEFTEDGERF